MQKITRTIAFPKSNGDLAVLAGANASVYETGTATLASLYGDDETTPKDNPLTSDVNGLVEFKVANGTYDISYTNGGNVVTESGVLVYDPADAGAFDPANVNLTGGFINGVVIGNINPTDATFNDVDVQGEFTN